MDEPTPKQAATSANRRLFEVWVASIVWVVWVILPSLMLDPLAATSGKIKLVIAAQIGSTAVPYLVAAPPPLIMYLLASYLLALPVLILLARHLVRDSHTLVLSMNGPVVPLGLFLLMEVAGAAIVIVTMLARGAPKAPVLDWGPRLMAYGLLSLVPQLGWVFGVALAMVRPWRSVALTLLGALLCAVTSPVLVAKGVQLPTPMVLRGELFSGRIETLSSAAIGLLSWGIVPVLFGLLVRDSHLLRVLWSSLLSRSRGTS